MVLVTLRAASLDSVPAVKMTSTVLWARSAARAGNRSGCPSVYRTSNRSFRPSVHPRSCGAVLRSPCSVEPLSELDVVAVGIADLRSGVPFAELRPPDEVDPLRPQEFGRRLHVIDFERHHAIAEVLVLRSGLNGSALIRNELDCRTAQIQVHKAHRHAKRRAVDPVAGPHLEPQDLRVEFYGSDRLVRDDLHMIDPLEHA